MSVDYIWRRTPAQVAAGLDRAQLAALVPYWFDEAFDDERDRGIVVGLEDTGALVGRLLVLGAGDGAYRALAERLHRGPEDFDDDAMVGTFGPDVVGPAADFMADPPVEEWMQRHADTLAGYARTLGYGRPFRGEFERQVVDDARELATLVRQAAANDEILVLRIFA